MVRNSLAKILGWGACLCCSWLATAQQSPITVVQRTLITSDDPTTPYVESWLAANPRDPKNRIAVSIAVPGDMKSMTAVYFTRDAGRNWKRAATADGNKYFHGTDPSITFGPDGTAYYVNEDRGVTFFQYSKNGGESWTHPIILDSNDHPLIAIDASDGVYSNRIYFAGSGKTFTAQGHAGNSVEFGYSDDATHFTQRNFLTSNKGADGKEGWSGIGDLAVAPDGTVVLAYRGGQPAPVGQFGTTEEYWVVTSNNGGRTFSEPHKVATTTWPAELNRTKRIISFPKLAVDHASHHRGRLYFAYLALSDGWERVKVIHSDDRGQTWSAPVEPGSDSTHTDQGVPGIAVSRDGIVGVVWYDRRKDPQNECFQQYFAASLDGGVSFLPAQPLQEPATCPKTEGNERLHGAFSAYEGDKWHFGVDTAASRFPNGGDTVGLIGLDQGGFHTAGVTGDAGLMQLTSTEVHVSGKPMGRDVTDRLGINIGKPQWDLAAHKMSVQITIANNTQISLPGPFSLELADAHSNHGQLDATNAQNGFRGAGAIWELQAPHGQSTLAPGAVSLPVTLKFDIGEIQAVGAQHPGVDLDMTFRIFDATGR